MAQFDFNMYILNVTPDQVLSFSNTLIDGAIHIRITLNPTITSCPYCGGPVKLKEYSSHTFNHLPIAGHPSVIVWRRRRYVCKDCSRSFSETNPFGPETLPRGTELLLLLSCYMPTVSLPSLVIHFPKVLALMNYIPIWLSMAVHILPYLPTTFTDLSVISSRTVPSALFPNTSNRSLWKKGNACDSLPSIFGSHIKT